MTRKKYSAICIFLKIRQGWNLVYGTLAVKFIKKGGIFISHKKTKEYFTRFPNMYIQSDIRKTFGLSRKFYIIYILIDKYRSYENYSWLTLRKILDFYGYKTNKNKPKAVYEIIDVLKYMIDNNMIKVKQDLESLSYDTGIEIKIIPENFDCVEKFTMITSSQLKTIMMADKKINKENVLLTFLYINSHIGCRRKNNRSEQQNFNNIPEAFFKSIETMSKEISMSKETILQCIEYLISSSEKHDALLIKKEVGNIKTGANNPPKNVPNIYVLNKEGYQEEIKCALKKILEIYNVKEN